jgi:large subunit ribosomal protein L22
MNEAKAKLNNYRQSPRKVRLVASAVRGKTIAQALDVLSFVPNRAAEPLLKLLASAKANAQAKNIPVDNLTIKELRVDEGPTLYRRRPRSRGMANPIRKRTSHVTVIVAEGAPKKIKAKKLKSQEAKS